MNSDSLPTLDAHGHLDSSKPALELDACGAVLAMTLSPDEAEAAVRHQTAGRNYSNIVWAVGYHPGVSDAQSGFDPGRFKTLAEKTAVIGEIGLDKASAVPLETQVRTFRAILAIAADLGRPVSIHSAHATALALDELERTRVPAAILHWWLGSAGQTSRAVALGCYFSIHAQIAGHSKFRTRVPLERVLIETDHGYDDPPAGIPARLEETERLVAGQYGIEAGALRRQVWQNFGGMARRTGVTRLLPPGITAILAGI